MAIGNGMRVSTIYIRGGDIYVISSALVISARR